MQNSSLWPKVKTPLGRVDVNCKDTSFGAPGIIGTRKEISLSLFPISFISNSTGMISFLKNPETMVIES